MESYKEYKEDYDYKSKKPTKYSNLNRNNSEFGFPDPLK